MGYRSDVTIIFYARGNSNDAGRNTILKLWFDENFPVMVAKDEWGATIRHKGDGIIIDYEDVKWYDGYVHPREVDAALKKFNETFECDKEEGHYAYEFLRIGEEDTDIEVERSDWNDHLLYVSRSIRVDMEGVD